MADPSLSLNQTGNTDTKDPVENKIQPAMGNSSILAAHSGAQALVNGVPVSLEENDAQLPQHRSESQRLAGNENDHPIADITQVPQTHGLPHVEQSESHFPNDDNVQTPERSSSQVSDDDDDSHMSDADDEDTGESSPPALCNSGSQLSNNNDTEMLSQNERRVSDDSENEQNESRASQDSDKMSDGDDENTGESSPLVLETKEGRIPEGSGNNSDGSAPGVSLPREQDTQLSQDRRDQPVQNRLQDQDEDTDRDIEDPDLDELFSDDGNDFDNQDLDQGDEIQEPDLDDEGQDLDQEAMDLDQDSQQSSDETGGVQGHQDEDEIQADDYSTAKEGREVSGHDAQNQSPGVMYQNQPSGVVSPGSDSLFLNDGDDDVEDALMTSLNRPTPASDDLDEDFPSHTASTQASSSRIPPPSIRAAANPHFARLPNMQNQRRQSRTNAPQPRQLRQSTPAIPEDDQDEEKADRIARSEYAKKKTKYDKLRRENGGRLDFIADVEWMKIEAAETVRINKRKRDEELAREEQEAAHSVANGEEQDDDDHDEENDPAGSSRAHREASTRVPSMQEAELRSMQVALQNEGDKPQRKKRKGAHTAADSDAPESSSRKGRGARAKTGASSKAGASKPQGKPKGRESTKEKKEKERALRLGRSMLGSNVFRQQAAPDAPTEPTFTGRNKGAALKQLVASVPLEHKKSLQDDSAALMRATRDFDGRGACRLAGVDDRDEGAGKGKEKEGGTETGKEKPKGTGMWKLKGMQSTLKAYQVMGSAFMRRRERSAEEPRGGLMADQMGLGKTLMMLANIVNGKAPKDAECKTTLIVASPALLAQWRSEIEKHTNAGLVVMKYSAGNRLDSNQKFQIIMSHDIILTTYQEVLRSYPKNDPPITCQTAEEKMLWWQKRWEEDRGALHRIRFHRVVLDEAQCIKNHLSQTSIACRALMAHHKWALSGTPILNSLNELYSYFKFLNVPHTGNFKLFKNNYTDSKDPENIERLLVRLSQFMIRRDHSDVLFNAPILKLPQASRMTSWATFNPVERKIYEVVRQRFARRINMHAARGDLDKGYSNALVMLLRLRQLTAHILLLQFVVQDLLEQDDIHQIREVVNQEATNKRDQSGETILAIRKQLDHLEAEAKKTGMQKPPKGSKIARVSNAPKRSNLLAPVFDDEEPKEGNHDIAMVLRQIEEKERDSGGTGHSFGKKFDFRPYLDSMTIGENWEKVKERTRCEGCGKKPRGQFWITNCGHVHCADCFDGLAAEAAEEGRHSSACKGCGSVYVRAEDLNNGQERIGPEMRGQDRRERQRVEEQDIADHWLNWTKGGVLPSAKTIALKAQLLNWFRENPKVKVIVYTQFLAMIRIIKKICQEEGWGTEEYHGKMSQGARDKAIRHFAEPEGGVSILLASLRCGGLGLNLTMASKVVILDPWWNEASEQQAFCRVFRYGQQEETFLMRFCVRNTVDDRLIEMQERKQKEIDSVMEDGGSTMKKIGMRDLMRLFGNLSDDGKFILIDNPDPRGGFRADRDHEGYADEN